jgi:hypothetical protein
LAITSSTGYNAPWGVGFNLEQSVKPRNLDTAFYKLQAIAFFASSNPGRYKGIIYVKDQVKLFGLQHASTAHSHI